MNTIRRDLSITDPVVEAYKQGIDRTLIRENLRISVQERFENLMALQRFAEELQHSKTQKRDHTI